MYIFEFKFGFVLYHFKLQYIKSTQVDDVWRLSPLLAVHWHMDNEFELRISGVELYWISVAYEKRYARL